MPPTTRAAKARGTKASIAPSIAKSAAKDAPRDKYADNVLRLETELIEIKRDIEKNERDIDENERMREKARVVADPAMRAFALKMIDDTHASCLQFRDKCLDHARRIVICIDKWKALASSD